MQAILDITPQQYQRHKIHTQDRDWAETNCYVDVWIELLHALDLDPMAAMSFSLTQDFEGDQWTFFKFQLNELYDLYGLEVQELVIWKSLIENIQEQVALGRPVLVELDSMYLPDTAGTAYHQEHVKSTVAVNYIDAENQKMGYFHAQGYYELSGDDFVEVFALPGAKTKMTLAPYVEVVKTRQQVKRSKQDLQQLAMKSVMRQLQQLPTENPFIKFRHQFEKDFAWLLEQPIAKFHEYAFVTFRQFGACFELAANFLEWLDADDASLKSVVERYKSISQTTKVYQFQLARALNRKKMVDLSAIDEMAKAWQYARDELTQYFAAKSL
ncbi:MAG: DUF1839 family protein [Gammaproteobacteria bacterium]|nr:DUF1839 family protein [Gammaproteobacteria bacterium]